MKRILLFSLVAMTMLTACDEKVAKSFPIEIICDQPISENGKYPNYFQKVLMPNEFDDKLFLIPKPIKVKRVDISNSSISIDPYAFENTADPTYELYFNWLPVYFRDSVPPKELLTAKGSGITASDWITGNTDKTIIVLSGNTNTTKGSNLFYCEDEVAANTKIVELLKANPETKIYLVNCPECGGSTEVIRKDTSLPNCSDKFCVEVHQKLMEIARCEKGKEKVYEERFALAKAFCEQYVDANTVLGQYTGEGGFKVKDHKGEEVAKYIRALAEPNICMTDLQIVVIVPASNGKIGEIKLKEIQAGI